MGKKITYPISLATHMSCLSPSLRVYHNRDYGADQHVKRFISIHVDG